MFYRRIISFLLSVIFFTTQLISVGPVFAQSMPLVLPLPGTRVDLSSAYQPLMIKGLKINPHNPMQFDFLISTGDSKYNEDNKNNTLKAESVRLIKYFLACLAISENELWVNLSPYEKDRIIPDALGETELGRDLLAQDYILKQLTASLIDPEKSLGKEFWDRVYQKAQQQYGSTNIPINTFNKVWILADTAKVFEHNNTAFVVNSHLKVILEQDYLATTKNQSQPKVRQPGDMFQKEQQNVSPSTLPSDSALNTKAPQGNPPSRNVSTTSLSSQIIKEIIIPELEKEINEGKNFSTIRQIFHAFILASWYKKNMKQSFLNQIYSDKNKTQGLEFKTTVNKEQSSLTSNKEINIEHIYQQYLQAYQKGVFNYIKEEPVVIKDMNGKPVHSTVARKYFSGGTKFLSGDMSLILNPSELNQAQIAQIKAVDYAMTTDLRNVETSSINFPKEPFKDFFPAEFNQIDSMNDPKNWGRSDSRYTGHEKKFDEFPEHAMDEMAKIVRSLVDVFDDAFPKSFVLYSNYLSVNTTSQEYLSEFASTFADTENLRKYYLVALDKVYAPALVHRNSKMTKRNPRGLDKTKHLEYAQHYVALIKFFIDSWRGTEEKLGFKEEFFNIQVSDENLIKELSIALSTDNQGLVQKITHIINKITSMQDITMVDFGKKPKPSVGTELRYQDGTTFSIKKDRPEGNGIRYRVKIKMQEKISHRQRKEMLKDFFQSFQPTFPIKMFLEDRTLKIIRDDQAMTAVSLVSMATSRSHNVVTLQALQHTLENIVIEHFKDHGGMTLTMEERILKVRAAGQLIAMDHPNSQVAYQYLTLFLQTQGEDEPSILYAASAAAVILSLLQSPHVSDMHKKELRDFETQAKLTLEAWANKSLIKEEMAATVEFSPIVAVFLASQALNSLSGENQRGAYDVLNYLLHKTFDSKIKDQYSASTLAAIELIKFLENKHDNEAAIELIELLKVKHDTDSNLTYAKNLLKKRMKELPPNTVTRPDYAQEETFVYPLMALTVERSELEINPIYLNNLRLMILEIENQVSYAPWAYHLTEVMDYPWFMKDQAMSQSPYIPRLGDFKTLDGQVGNSEKIWGERIGNVENFFHSGIHDVSLFQHRSPSGERRYIVRLQESVLNPVVEFYLSSSKAGAVDMFAFIKSNFRETNLSLEDLAQHLINEVQLNLNFKVGVLRALSQYKNNPTEHLGLNIEQAEDLIKNGKLLEAQRKLKIVIREGNTELGKIDKSFGINRERSVSVLKGTIQRAIELQKQVTKQLENEINKAMSPGGIDLKIKDLKMDIEQQGAGIKMTFDSAMREQLKFLNGAGLVPVILKITAINGAGQAFNLEF